MKKPTLTLSLDSSWQFVSSAVLILSLIGLLLLTSLNTLLPGYSSDEATYVTQTATPAAILDNPEFLPHKVLSFILHFPTSDNHLSARLASAFIGGLVVLLFYYAANKWYSRRTAFLATAMLATSAWFLHTARIAIPDITYPAAILALGLTAYKLQVTKRPILLWSFAILLVGFLWYIPGVLWFVAAGITLQYRRLQRSKLDIPKKKLPWLLLPITAVVGLLVYLVVRNVHTLKVVLGVSGGVPTPIDYVLHVLYTPFIIAFRAPLDAGFRLGHMPYLDIISVVLLAGGIYYYLYYRKSLRTRLVLLITILGVLLSAFQTYDSQAILLVPAYVLIAAGISVFANQWLTVFPRNPVARTFGVLAVTVVVGMSCVYNLRSYFIAWPSAPETKSTYNQVL